MVVPVLPPPSGELTQGIATITVKGSGDDVSMAVAKFI
jgi:hypothetical protein